MWIALDVRFEGTRGDDFGVRSNAFETVANAFEAVASTRSTRAARKIQLRVLLD